MAFFTSILCALPPTLENNSLQLPHYSIKISQKNLNSLRANPYQNIYYPAVFTYKTERLECLARFRGGTARNLPKKSWRIKFPNDDNPFDAEHINFNAEYRDRSMMRNHLAMSLFRYFDFPAPQTKHISLFINGDYAGVYVQVEDIEQEFFDKNNIKTNNVYKAKNSGASMAPLTSRSHYATTWEKKKGPFNDFSDLQRVLHKIYYWNHFDFERYIENEVSIDTILNYFAIEFTLASFDCFTKNMFLYYDETAEQWALVPWDNDATFGYDWKGNYHAEYAEFLRGHPIDHHLLFQRLMEYGHYKNRFSAAVQTIITEGFDFLTETLDRTWHQIRHDVYQDNSKSCSNEEYDAAQDEIKMFLKNRKAFLQEHDYPKRIVLSDPFCSNPFPGQSDSVLFRITAAEPAHIRLLYTNNLNWKEWSHSYTQRSIPMYDDGMHNDGDAGDLIYGALLSIKNWTPALVPYCFKVDDLYYPANGLFYIHYVRTNSFAMHILENQSHHAKYLKIGDIYKLGRDTIVELVNTSTEPLDISYCHLQAGACYQSFLIPENTIIPANDTLLITSDISLKKTIKKTMIGTIFFSINLGDSVKILSPTRTTLCSKLYESYAATHIKDPLVIISEFSYNSSESCDTKDWIELYNPHADIIDISGYSLKDDNDNHSFNFPRQTLIAPQDYLVLCRDSTALLEHYPYVQNYNGNMGFGLSRYGDQIRIFDMLGRLVDSLAYSIGSDWPEDTDEGCHTLELLNPQLDNTYAENWVRSKTGTPGYRNSVFVKNNRAVDNFNNCRLVPNIPNPFNYTTRIEFSAPLGSAVDISIYNINGQLVRTMTPGENRFHVLWDASNLSSGVYFYNLRVNGVIRDSRKALLIK